MTGEARQASPARAAIVDYLARLEVMAAELAEHQERTADALLGLRVDVWTLQDHLGLLGADGTT